MIRSHIGFTQECGVVLKLERFFHLLSRSFGLSSQIGLEALSDHYPGKIKRLMVALEEFYHWSAL